MTGQANAGSRTARTVLDRNAPRNRRWGTTVCLDCSQEVGVTGDLGTPVHSRTPGGKGGFRGPGAEACPGSLKPVPLYAVTFGGRS